MSRAKSIRNHIKCERIISFIFADNRALAIQIPYLFVKYVFLVSWQIGFIELTSRSNPRCHTEPANEKDTWIFDISKAFWNSQAMRWQHAFEFWIWLRSCDKRAKLITFTDESTVPINCFVTCFQITAEKISPGIFHPFATTFLDDVSNNSIVTIFDWSFHFLVPRASKKRTIKMQNNQRASVSGPQRATTKRRCKYDMLSSNSYISDIVKIIPPVNDQKNRIINSVEFIAYRMFV